MAYVYRHVRVDKNQPFYIGIGTDNNYKRARNLTGERANKTDFRYVVTKEFQQINK